MKLQFKALSVTLGLVAFLGVSTSVKSETTNLSGTDSSVELSSDEMDTSNVEELEATDEYQTEELEATDEYQTEDLEATEEIEDTQLEATEEIEDAENAEIETPELEAIEEADSIDESSNIEGTEDTVNDVDSQF